MTNYDCEIIKTAAKRNLYSYLQFLLPNGKIKGHEFLVGNIQGNKGESLKIEMQGAKAGLWVDHATGESGDIITLWELVKNVTFVEALQQISLWLGLGTNLSTTQNNVITQSWTWTYTDVIGQPLVRITRRDSPEGKTYSVFDVVTQQHKAPEIRPLYNLPNLSKSDTIYIVEGEKAADALIKNGYTATTAMGGANTPFDKTDWTPLKNKHIIIWPDNDKPGKQYAEKLSDFLWKTNEQETEILEISNFLPKGFDAADVQEGEMADFLQNTPCKKVRDHKKLRLSDWRGNRYLEPATPQKYLVDGMFPMGCASIVAATGDTGKGLILLDLALKVINPENNHCAFGPQVLEHGSVVILAAEDDFCCLSNRVESIDLERLRNAYGDRLHLVPLPNAGGPFPVLHYHQKKLEVTSEFEEIRKQIDEIQNLKLIILDPLASFVQGDINGDAALGAFMTGTLAKLATETGAAVIVAHHMRKPAQGIMVTADTARDMIRGTSALVDGVRCAFALWSVDEQKQDEIGAILNSTLMLRNSVYQGLIVKANHGADRKLKTYVRDQFTGLLQDKTDEIEQVTSGNNLPLELLNAIATAATKGHPFMHTGNSGVYKQRHRLPPFFHGLSRHKVEGLIQYLLNKKKITKGRAKGSSTESWLDIPGGPFARGEGELKLGAEGCGDTDD